MNVQLEKKNYSLPKAGGSSIREGASIRVNTVFNWKKTVTELWLPCFKYHLQRYFHTKANDVDNNE